MGYDDTVIGHRNERGEMEIESIHGNRPIFTDGEIHTYHTVVCSEFLQGSKIAVEFTEHGKPIIQQQGTRGCTAAAAAMLIYEWGGKVNIDGIGGLRLCNLGTTERIIWAIRKAGFEALITTCDYTLGSLEEALQRGSAIVSIVGKTFGGHTILVDEISMDGVRIRDPYHAWEITVDPDAFLQYWGQDLEIVQIAQKLDK